MIQRFLEFRYIATSAFRKFLSSPALTSEFPAGLLHQAAGIKAALEIARRFGTPPSPSKAGAFCDPAAVFERYRQSLGREKRETFVAMLLDAKNRLIRDVTISQGSLTQSIVHPREVFEPAIRDSAASVIFAHNHPSGDPTPSSEDIAVTGQLREAGRILGINVLDHLIIGKPSNGPQFVSLKERQLGFK